VHRPVRASLFGELARPVQRVHDPYPLRRQPVPVVDGIQPLAGVSSDLVASAVMKPVGGLVHLRRGTVNLSMVKWLCVGSIPMAFAGVFLLRLFREGGQVQSFIRTGLGIALLLASGSMIIKAYLQLRERAQRRAQGNGVGPDTEAPGVRVRIVPTILIGALGGLIVGITSVGSGSLIIICLMTLYPMLKASGLVGTDLVQAVPLVASAAFAHILFGNFQLEIATPLLVGCLPGVFLGAHVSARAPSGIVRRALTLVLFASGLKLLGIANIALAWVLVAVALIGPVAWALTRKRHGFAALAGRQRPGVPRQGQHAEGAARPSQSHMLTALGDVPPHGDDEPIRCPQQDTAPYHRYGGTALWGDGS
jgi:uncharacterized membrane protein YfcA